MPMNINSDAPSGLATNGIPSLMSKVLSSRGLQANSSAVPRSTASSRQGTPGGFTVTPAQRLAYAFPGQPLYTEHGPSNRLVLSLASGIGSEVDFALERLLKVSQIDITLIQPDLYPGLVEALCDNIASFDKSPSKRPSPSFSSCFASQAAEDNIRRATQAATILRNLACEPDNFFTLWDRPQVLSTVLSVLENTAPRDASVPSDALIAQDTAQLRLMLLDILTVYAPQLSLQSLTAPRDEQDHQQTHMSSPDDDESLSKPRRLPPLPEYLQNQVHRIYPLVTQLCWSSDRAMILSAYYILAALATSTNASTFTFPSHSDSLEGTSNPVVRALQLLPLSDMELVSATLQFLFCYTDISSKNADSLASRTDIHQILRMLLSKALFAGTRQDLVANTKPSTQSRPLQTQPKIPTGPGLLPPAETRLLLAIPEPQRTTSWCQWMYVTQPASEIKQTVLWNTYKNQFISLATPESPLPQPGEFLNTLQSSFDRQVQVVRSSVDQKSFVVRGIQERDRQAMAATLRKHWSQHGAPAYLNGNPAQLPDDALLLAALKGLLQNQPQKVDIPEPKPSYETSGHEVRHSVWFPRTVDGLLAGHALYSILVLRNLSRAIRAVAAPPQRSQNDQVLSYLTPFGETDDDPTDTFVHGAGQAKDALLEMEENLLVLAMGAKALTPYLSEVLSDIAAISKSSGGAAASKKPLASSQQQH